jgi:hypothetical protein
MSNQDESAPYSKLPTYQFFSADLNYNYYTDSTDSKEEAPPTVPSPAASVVLASPKVAYSLTDDVPQPTFEERLAATTSLAATPELTWFEPTPISRTQETMFQTQEAEEKWNQYTEPNCAPINFSSEFDFNRSLLKIFWRIDVDHNNRVSKNELATALSENWFSGDETLLAALLYDVYEEISPEAVLCDAGLSVNNILNYAPFVGLSTQSLKPVTVTSPNNYDVRNSSQSRPKAKKLRNLFQKR